MELRSPHDTEPDAVVHEAGREVAALRRAADVGVDAPDAAAQQTARTSRGSCGVGHTSGWIRPVPILAPLPNIAQRVIETQGVWEFAGNWLSAVISPVLVVPRNCV